MSTYHFVFVMCDCCGEEAGSPGRDAKEARRYARVRDGYRVALPGGQDRCLKCLRHEEKCQ